MISLHAASRKCFICAKGNYVNFYLENSQWYVNGKLQCDNCKHVVKENLYAGDEIGDNVLVEEALDVNISTLSGPIDDVIAAAKELSTLYDGAYLKIQFCEDEIIGLRFETPIEKGERILAEQKKASGAFQKHREEIKKLQERYNYLKNKYTVPTEANNGQEN
jgi:hypothetical protein